MEVTCRTSSWDLPGERTDFHDIFSVLLAAYLRCQREPFGAALWDMSNPAVPVPETEIYARVTTPLQPTPYALLANQASLADLDRLCGYVMKFEGVFPRCFSWSKGAEADYKFSDEVEQWAMPVAKALDEDLDDAVQFNQRIGPDWHYYRSIRRHMSVIQSESLVSALAKLSGLGGLGGELRAINRQLFISERVRSAVALRALSQARRILSRLCGQKVRHVIVIPMENRLLVAAGAFTLVMTRECGLVQFREERGRVEQRHRREARLLFRPSRYIWQGVIDENRFEQMVYDLLVREPGVLRLRRVGQSRNADRGKDFIVDWITAVPANVVVPEGTAPMEVTKVPVQAKASSRSVGQRDVRDIRDTLDTHTATGYFLVVSSQLTSDLTDHLDRMRSEGSYWVDWWNRAEIEERLTVHPDVLARYGDIVTRAD